VTPAGAVDLVRRRLPHGQLLDAGAVDLVILRLQHDQLLDAGAVDLVRRRLQHSPLLDAGAVVKLIYQIETVFYSWPEYSNAHWDPRR
jgi:hypothetical protein